VKNAECRVVKGNDGMVEYWNIGMVEWWNIGMMERWGKPNTPILQHSITPSDGEWSMVNGLLVNAECRVKNAECRMATGQRSTARGPRSSGTQHQALSTILDLVPLFS